MRPDLWGMMRSARYALPRQIERVTSGPGPQAAVRVCGRLHEQRLRATVGHFPGSRETPESIIAANLLLAACLGERAGDVYLSVKAPQLGFDPVHLRAIAQAAAASGMSLMFDAHGLQHADRTHEVFCELLPEFPRTGCVLPARWRRTMADAAWFRSSPARLRVVKGEWADPKGDVEDIEANYLGVVRRLAGRQGTVAVATHSPRLAERALAILLDADTPCELEQLRGLPMRRTTAIARKWGVPVRVYVPFGPGWLPYAFDKALGRPYLLKWMMRDRLGFAD